MKSNRKKKKANRWLFIIPVAILAVVLIAGGSYVSSLLNLVEKDDYSGNMELDESDIFEPDDYVTTTTASTADPTSPSGGPLPTKPGGTVATTLPIETTVDPLIEIIANIENEQANLKMIGDKQVYNILLIGTDNRGNELNGRSDTMMILSVNKRTDEIHIVSLMRAMFVKIPGKGYSMINAAFSWGGANLLIKTIEENFKVPIHDYILINFSGFRQAIDTIGGINIYLSEVEAAHLNEQLEITSLVAGTNTLDGKAALAYARIRKIDSDFTRTGRQRAVIEALIRKVRSMSLGELDGLARQILPLVRSSRSGSSLLGLITDAYNWRNYPVKQLLIPVSNSMDLIIVRGAQMYRFDVTTNVEKLQAFLYY
ncbi:MAG: LCP family protein [Kiritimatiellae bacterium]|nr:LCP family protein [Kiritimatiellia bacterium]